MNVSRRTPKTFRNYNAYHDRGMMKWITAYAMDELVKGIDQNKREALKNNPQLPQMSRVEIDEKLTEAVELGRPMSIQLNEKDQWGRQSDSIVGLFFGFLPGGKIKVADHWIHLEDIRHIHVLNEGKWSKVTPFKNADALRVEEPTIPLRDDYSQDNVWME